MHQVLKILNGIHGHVYLDSQFKEYGQELITLM